MFKTNVSEYKKVGNKGQVLGSLAGDTQTS